MTSLGFENYAEALKIYLAKYREVSTPLFFSLLILSYPIPFPYLPPPIEVSYVFSKHLSLYPTIVPRKFIKQNVEHPN
jgi:hypothetical protein